MEKLIELLNEYGYKKENYKWIPLEYRPSFYFIEEQEVYYCSKKFGFIKWLVENEKIDVEKLGEKSEYTFIKNGGGEHIIEDVLMLLSIQDEPIEFLVSILK